MNLTTIRPRTSRRPSADLGCDVRKVFGYQATCDCGWHGKLWRTVRGARLEASFHLCETKAA